MAKMRVTDKATGKVYYVTPEELAAYRPPRREQKHYNFPPIPDDVPRAVAIKLIREALKKRSGKVWSVTGGTGTAYGWLRIDAPPARRIYDSAGNKTASGASDSGYMHPAEQAELGRLLGLKDPVHHQGESIPASSNHYREFIMRARGQEPTVRGEQYWD